MQVHSIRRDKAVSVVALEGNMNERELPSVENEIISLLEEHHGPKLIDLKEVTSIDSYALTFLLRFARSLHSQHSKLMLVAPSATVEAGLRRANFHTLIPMFRDVSSGLASIESAV